MYTTIINSLMILQFFEGIFMQIDKPIGLPFIIITITEKMMKRYVTGQEQCTYQRSCTADFPSRHPNINDISVRRVILFIEYSNCTIMNAFDQCYILLPFDGIMKSEMRISSRNHHQNLILHGS